MLDERYPDRSSPGMSSKSIDALAGVGLSCPSHPCTSHLRSAPQDMPPLSPAVPHAPKRLHNLTAAEFEQAVANALRYFPPSLHALLAPEFAQELREDGHIYMRRFMPTEYVMRAYPVDWYPAKSRHAACIMLMVQNNLDHKVAQVRVSAQYPADLHCSGACLTSLIRTSHSIVTEIRFLFASTLRSS